jgi:protocatechuate 4,5-dioxygenase alpha chain
MSVHALELLLHDLATKRDRSAALKADPDTLLARYRLTAEEAAMVRSFDVGAMQRHGVSPLLTIGFWLMNEESRSRTRYVERLKQTVAEHS